MSDSGSDSEIKKLITTLIENFESNNVTGNCIIILKNALNKETIDEKIKMLKNVKNKLQSETMFCALGGEYVSTKINMKNNTKIKDKLILLIDNTINKIEKVQKKSLEEERQRKAEEARRKAEEERLAEEQAKQAAERLAEEEARKKAEAEQKRLEEQADQAAKNLTNLLSEAYISTDDAMIYFDNAVTQENIADDFISIEVKQVGEVEGGKKQAKKPKRKANKTKRVKKSNKKKRKPKRKTMRKIKKIIFR